MLQTFAFKGNKFHQWELQDFCHTWIGQTVSLTAQHPPLWELVPGDLCVACSYHFIGESLAKQETARLLWQAQIQLFKPIEINTCIFSLLTFSDNIREIFFSNSTISAMFPGIAGEDRISGMMHEKSAWQLLFPWSSAPKCFASFSGFPCTGLPAPTKGRCPPATPMWPPELGRGSRSEILWREKNKFCRINEQNQNDATATTCKIVQCWGV